MVVGFITRHNADDVTDRSGVPFFIVHFLRKMNHKVVIIKLKDERTVAQRFISRIYHLWYNKILKSKRGFYSAEYSQPMWKSYQKQFKKHSPSLDILVSIDLLLLTYIDIKTPIIAWVDNITETYTRNPAIGPVCNLNRRYTKNAEAVAIKKLHHLFTASEWLREIVCKKYAISNTKVSTLPRGASLFTRPAKQEVAHWIAGKKNQGRFNVLFICSNWITKGGKRFLDLAGMLQNESAIGFSIMGRVPEKRREDIAALGIEYKGYIDKSNNREYAIYIEQLKQAHLLVILSPAEGFGITFTEAASFGVPSLGFEVTGITQSVKNQVTGLLFPLETENGILSDAIMNLHNNREKWASLSFSSKSWADEHFDWQKNLSVLLHKVF
jgi:glycosyltransferase involved in cell wall biosynthesis